MGCKTAVIIGAGPAGLTAALELLEKTDIRPIVLEMTSDIGGISKTVNHKGNRIDIGGHRFFSKSDRVMDYWRRVFPVQGQPARDDIAVDRLTGFSDAAGAPDPEKTDEVLLMRNRISRIFFMRKFFDYPLGLDLKTIRKLGMFRVFRIALSYIKARIFPVRNERTLEDFIINRFGRELYLTFFKDYTEKVWGAPCSQIPAEWGVQRIKGLSIARAIKHAAMTIFSKNASIEQKQTETSLISQFLYPKLGPGQMWEQVARTVESKGGKIYMRHEAVGVKTQDAKVKAVEVKDLATGQVTSFDADYVLSTMPVRDLIRAMGNIVPADVRSVSEGLIYRDFITVGLLLKKLKLKNETNIRTVNGIVPDNWIYIQERDVKIGRLQIFNNWSPYMVRDDGNVWIGLEYFCTEGDELWRKPNDDFIKFAISELVKIDIIEENDVIDSVLIKMPKTYPAYFGTYDRFGVIRDYVDRFDNLFLIGRNGMHRYNNQDHSMLTAMTAVENIVAGIKTKSNIWDVNTEKEYHESKVTAVEQLTEAYSAVNKTEDFQYDPDIYWEDTAISYPYYPTVRHRRRFVLNSISKYVANPAGCTVFDYGCGEGEVLKEIKDHFGLDDSQLAGCDISGTAIQMAKKKIDSGNLFPEVFPKINRKPDIVVCCEVIEHTADYYQILRWIFENIAHGGKLILTTQSGKIHASDRYTGHTQHFDIKYLKSLLEDIGFNIEYSSLWGFPLFTVQKYLTNLRFDRIRENYLEGQLTLRKKVVFSLAYLAYYMHDVIKFGPQIYIVAVKSKHPVK